MLSRFHPAVVTLAVAHALYPAGFAVLAVGTGDLVSAGAKFHIFTVVFLMMSTNPSESPLRPQAGHFQLSTRRPCSKLLSMTVSDRHLGQRSKILGAGFAWRFSMELLEQLFQEQFRVDL